jgi:dTMP kinase
MDFSAKGPFFISFEGGEGCGKTTQLKLFCDWLTQEGVPLVQTREPGGSPIGPDIRKILLEGAQDKMEARTESLLFAADRNEHMRQIILPALAQGQWVVTDRFADSTTVYQSYSRGVAAKTLQVLHNMVVSRWPDLTFVLDIPVAEGLGRKGKQVEEGLTETRFEDMGESIHEKIRAGFLKVAEENPQRCRVIDARGSIEEVQNRLRKSLMEFLQEQKA